MAEVNSFEFGLIKDPHFMFGFRNGIRKHGWERDIDAKINFIIEYLLSNNIKYLFMTGDLHEKNRKDAWSFNQLQQNKERFRRFKRAGIEIFSNMGNHDYFNGYEGIEGTVFGELVELGLITYIGTGMEPIEFKIQENENPWTLSLYGIDHHQNIDKILNELERISFAPSEQKIVLMHSNITDTNEIVTDFTYEQLSQFNIDVIGCGHWHLKPKNGMVQQVNGTYFLNPWNLTRVTREYHVKLDEHKPTLIHGSCIKISSEYLWEFKEIEIPHKPFSEAFNPDIINILQNLGKEDFHFFRTSGLDKFDELEQINDEDLLERIAVSHSFSKESIKIARELLT